MSSKSEQWNEFFLKGNQIEKDLDNIERVLKVATLPECQVSIYAGKETSYPNTVLPRAVMERILHSVIDALSDIKQRKEFEMDKLMGIRKPAAINPEFEAATKDMFDAVHKPDPVEDKSTEIVQPEAKPVQLKPSEILEAHVTEIEKMYKVDMATVGAIADKYGVKKTDVNTFLAKHKLFRTKRKDDDFLDSKVQARRSSSR